MVTLLLSLLAIAGIILMLYSAVALVQDKRLFGSAPKDIQAVVKLKPERFKGQHLLGWVLIIVSLLILAAVLVIAVWDGVRNEFGFWQFFARFLIILYAYKAFDMVCFDWLLLTRSRFFQHYYPETEGCAGYRQFGFNRKEQLVRIILFLFVALLLAWICTLF